MPWIGDNLSRRLSASWSGAGSKSQSRPWRPPALALHDLQRPQSVQRGRELVPPRSGVVRRRVRPHRLQALLVQLLLDRVQYLRQRALAIEELLRGPVDDPTASPYLRLLDELLDTLEPRARFAVEARFGLADGERKSFREVGEQLGVTAEAARRLVSRAVAGLRDDAERILAV